MEDAFNYAVHQSGRQRETVARAVIAPLVGDVHRRERYDGAGEGTAPTEVPLHRPEVLDELGRCIRGRPPI
jgi:hypothetical protein